MDIEFTKEQQDVIDAKGDTVVSASAGSGKTTVMIERLVQKIIKWAKSGDEAAKDDGSVSLENVLAVTFTKKAAENMRDKLRSRLGEEISKMGDAEGDAEKKGYRDRLMGQYNLIASADISTIHSFCLNLIKKYFYLANCDANPEMLDDDDSEAALLREKAFDNLFNGEDGETGYYGERDGEENLRSDSFSVLLKYLRSSRRDDNIKEVMMSAYKKVRCIAGYRDRLEKLSASYTEQGFNEVCRDLSRCDKEKFDECFRLIDKYERDNMASFYPAEAEYKGRLDSMRAFLKKQESCIKNLLATDEKDRGKVKDEDAAGVCEYSHDVKDFPGKVTKGELSDSAKKILKDSDLNDEFNETGKAFTAFKNSILDIYKSIIGDPKTFERKSYEEEKRAYLQAGEVASAFCRCLLDFDDEYSKVKKEENKLDYNDLEHLAIDLLSNHEDVRAEVNEKYRLVFVDEFQDINPAQKTILSYLEGEKFYVGDVKQAIYAFRGSDSKYFTSTIDEFKEEGKNSLRLARNFRSEDGIINRVNDVFGVSMTDDSCGISYGEEHKMDGSGTDERSRTQVHIFSKGGNEKTGKAGIYSVRSSAVKARRDDGEKAVAELVKRYRETREYEDKEICVLARKKKRVRAVAKKLEEEGVPISGTEGGNILENSEIVQILDMLSYIDDSEQDYPMISSMLSPMGDFTDDELATIRLAGRSGDSFRECVRGYRKSHDDAISEKIDAFEEETKKLKEAAKILSAGALIDKMLRDTGMELRYSQCPDKLRAVSMLASEGEDMTLSAFLKTVKAKDAKINMPACSASDGVKVMTMHSAKGLEFPVVIICDAAESYRGGNEYTYLFDEKLGFAFKSYDDDKLQKNGTLLWLLIDERKKKEEVKEELNLFYVACTRARKRLDIVASIDPEPYDLSKAKKGGNYADIIDLKDFEDGEPDDMSAPAKAEGEEDEEAEKDEEDEIGGLQAEDTLAQEPVAAGDESEDADAFEAQLRWVLNMGYSYKYMNAPAKTSVSAAIRDEDPEANHMFGEDEGEDGKISSKRADGAAPNEVGTAYHKFLELCDFAIRDAAGIESEIERFFAEGKMTKSQKDILLNDLKDGDDVGPVEALERVCDELYSKGRPKEIRRERRFLCNLPASDVYREKYREGDDAGGDLVDDVLVQGIIDLLVQYEDGSWRIIDYKHSTKDMGALWETYGKQLELYRAAAAIIVKAKESDIGTTLVNINPEKKVKNA